MEILRIGKTTYRNRFDSFGIRHADRRHHIYIIGKTGTGKSTLLKNMLIQDLRAGNGLALIDPHGDLVEDLLNFVPKTRTNEVVYFNPADTQNPIGINILEAKGEDDKNLVASSLLSIFRHLWKEFWGPRLEYVLYNAVLALMDTPGNTLLGVHRILVDDEFRKQIVGNIKDPVVKMFWIEDYEKYDERFRKEIIAPVQNKIGQLLTSATLRNIVGQTKSSVDFNFVMDNKRILFANLSKGKIGEDKSNLLGSAIVTKLYLAALERQNTSEEHRRDFYLYIDEFQNFAAESFISMLAEARKYRLSITLAHQNLVQLPSTLRASILSNPFYTGLFRYGGELHEGKYEPIISKKLFDQAQEMLKLRGKPDRKPLNEPQAFCGLISCASCGMMITGEYKVKKQQNGNVHEYVYYHCTKKNKNVKCAEPCIRQEELNRQLSSEIKKISRRERTTDLFSLPFRQTIVLSHSADTVADGVALGS
ncbi:MAG: type IV secretion system DNA-binding domain-containing protein [Candidatus Portnoybacteria bacterium]|nr:type IV secretion system DNA-binding domain-containing protein [Candidatus Portnoybacteria bacterium]